MEVKGKVGLQMEVRAGHRWRLHKDLSLQRSALMICLLLGEILFLLEIGS